MAISFIITTYNVLPYIQRCLESVAAVVQPGDEVILVDDGSNDGTVEQVQAFVNATPFPKEVAFHPIYLGTNTFGGVGIGANIGLTKASCDTIFFVDGDDWIDPPGFAKARAHWVLNPSDILLTNYLEFDETARQTRQPADTQKWAVLNRDAPLSELRLQALALIAVPWRKFYRRDFLESHKLRFPEGDFFFEDNPFHWAVCLRANAITFLDVVICYHRTNRPGQTMASTGAELAAFFTHFRTIQDDLSDDDDRLQFAAASWLIENMAWQMDRLAPSAYGNYAKEAARSLAMIPDHIWEGPLAEQESGRDVWAMAERLRSGDIYGQIDSWERQALNRELARMDQRLQELAHQGEATHDQVMGLVAARDFAILHERKCGR